MKEAFKWVRFFSLLIVLLALTVHVAFADDDDDDEDINPPHYYYIQKYEGTKTCLKCHKKEAEDVFHSLHYQWSTKASAEDLIGVEPGTKVGKMHDINDFCTNPMAPWIDRYVNKEGKVIVDGCAKCHIGFGKKPSEKMTEKELENIDCLMCHAPGYSRKVVKDKDGKLHWVPNMDADILTLRAKNVTKPTAAMCLKCHAGSGGGANFKRGDIEMAHYEAEEDLDVHFANDMSCVDCHTTKNHRIAGRGVDLAARDLPGEKVACENCHDAEPHESDVLNRHTQTVYCTTCHIPDYARYDATDVDRDWSRNELEENGKHGEITVLKKHVKPVYMWWNGKSIFQDTHKPAKAVNGYVKMVYPDGSINDPNAKIYAMKRHVAKLPILKKERLILPINVNTVFKTGDINKAVIEGAKAYFGKDIIAKDYEWIKVERYMGLFHEVVGGDKALKCQDCHGKNGRMDWKALGYKGDPRKFGGRFNTKKHK